jgi:hypothetical protein
MPNNCNSIIKKFIYVLVCITVSCSTINKDNKYNIYSGKLLIESTNVEPVSLNIVISLSKLESIIQLKKPFYGNVLIIEARENKNLNIMPTKNSNPFYIPDTVKRNFKYWLRQCLLSRGFNINELVEGSYFNFTCSRKDNKVNFNISYQENLINGYLIKK